VLFTDTLFLFYFLPIALFMHWLATLPALKRGQYGNLARVTIFVLSVVFYGFKSPWWLIPFFLSIAFDFIWASLLHRVEDARGRKLLVCLSVLQNLSLLALFKYWDFIGDNLSSAGSGVELPHLSSDSIGRLGLPAGISFYTFESLSFVVDVYRREVVPPRNPLRFFAFIAMFPRFIAGPIVRYKDMTAQFSSYRGMQVQRGLAVFAVGLFLKTCLADSCEVFSNYAFSGGEVVLDAASAWLGVFAYSLQIYLDFSGYSLMATGLGLALGFEFPPNFNRPYLAASITDFWRRWHMSLSTWLRDYLYIPLGGSRRGEGRTQLNLFLTMVIGGLWHGASWLFVLWGAWHGLWLCFERAFPIYKHLPDWLNRARVFLQVMLGWVLFRATSVKECQAVLSGLVSFGSPGSFNASGLAANPMHVGFFVLAVLYCFVLEGRLPYPLWKSLEQVSFARSLVAAALLILSLLVAMSAIKPIPFLYFQF
jgi:alginate O-acetyltransferase complex protein AlgI